jgi:membrane protein implicated in regulation of membrane protease activity
MMLAGLCNGGVAISQATLPTLICQGQRPQLSIDASTLIIAAFFNGLRRCFRDFMDRRLYRGKYDAAKVLETFSARLRDETARLACTCTTFLPSSASCNGTTRLASRTWLLLIALAGLLFGLSLPTLPSLALAQDAPATEVSTESELRAAWADPTETTIELAGDIYLRQCRTGDPIRESARPMTLDGNGHTLRQTCAEKRVLRQDGTGFLVLKNVTLTRGGSDGPGAAVTTRGEIEVIDSKVQRNRAEEAGGGIFSMRRATIVRSVITGNVANDDGGGVYARRGGVQVFDSIVSNNAVDGSGGAIGSTGDILLVRVHADGNTTDGDGGALYADEDGDVTVIDSTVDGNNADGPGGAIWTLDGDVTVVNSTINGNRSDDRGGAIGGEADVDVINSTIARNAAVAHVAGGIWARGYLYVANSTVSNNYAEGEGGGILGAEVVRLDHTTILDNVAPVAANVGAGERLESFASIIGPAKTTGVSGHVQPSETNCRVSSSTSFGYNFVTDASCGLDNPKDIVVQGDPMLGALRDNGGSGETRLPESDSPVLDRIPAADCNLEPSGEMLQGKQNLKGLVEERLVQFAKDQRGVSRPQGPACDIGAVELESTGRPNDDLLTMVISLVTGVVLVTIGLVLFLVDLSVTNHGLLTARGILALLAGGFVLLAAGVSHSGVLLGVLGVVTAVMGLVYFVVLRSARALRDKPARTGREGMIGEIGIVRKAVGVESEGWVFVHGERWRATLAFAPEETEPPDRDQVVGVGRKVVVVGFGIGGSVVQVLPVEWPDYRWYLDLKD